MIKQYGGTGKIFACVSDSYDIYKACEMWGTVLKQDIIDSGCTVVVRPDSGDPASTVNKCIEILAEHFGTTINSKGFKVLPSCIRVIQGDGINRDSIEEILRLIHWNGFSADNIAFGCGGALLQHMNRDTYGFAQKCCALLVDGVWRDVFKEAVGKNSKRGRLGLYTNPKGEYFSLNEDELMEHEQTLDLVTALDHQYFLLKTVDGYRPKVTAVTLDEVRSRGDSI
jgi:nicotinamide phosphoribosyltransferase